jgi:hypothetical protein
MASSLWMLDSKLQSVGYVPVLTRLTGDLASGVLLSQLVYWFRPSKGGKTKLRAHASGRLVLAKSRAELMAECGLTEWKLRAAMDKLKALGLVDSEVHLFNGKTCPFLFLYEDRLAQMILQVGIEETSVPVLRKPTKRLGGSIPTGREDSYQPLQETTTETLTETTSAAATPPPPDSEPSFDITVEEEEKGEEIGKLIHGDFRKEGTVATLEEIQKRMAEKKAAVPAASAGGSISPLVMLWKKRVSTITGGYVKDLTKQELGQLKLLGKQLGIEALTTMDWMLTNWAEFAFETKALKGLGAVPSQPVIGFLLKYHDVAMQLIARVTINKAGAHLKHPVEATVKVSAPITIEKASDEDVAAALKMFGGGE